jgi:hypothetical protein
MYSYSAFLSQISILPEVKLGNAPGYRKCEEPGILTLLERPGQVKGIHLFTSI